MEMLQHVSSEDQVKKMVTRLPHHIRQGTACSWHHMWSALLPACLPGRRAEPRREAGLKVCVCECACASVGGRRRSTEGK